MNTRKISRLIALSTISVLPTLSLQAVAYEAGDVIVRFGATTVEPQDSSSNVAINGGGVAGSGLTVDSNTQLGLTFSYMFDQNWGIELLAATPFEHTAKATGSLAAIGDVADVKHLPPTFMAIYYFDSKSKFKPYVGAGINYTVFFEEKLASDAKNALTTGDVELDDSWGLSTQIGTDYEINKKWHINGSVRWIDIDTEATVKLDNGAKITGDVDIDPYVYTLSIGYKF